MPARASLWRRWRLILAASTAALVAGPLWSHAPVPEPVAVRGDECVAPVDVMRREHMDMLMHQRDETVLKGIRTERFSLTGCVSCHAATDDAGEYIRVDAPGQFCSTCHEYTAVELDCFGCHAAVPAGDNPHE